MALTLGWVGATAWSGCCGWRSKCGPGCPLSLPSRGAAEAGAVPPGAETPSHWSQRLPTRAVGQKRGKGVRLVCWFQGIHALCPRSHGLRQWLCAPCFKKFSKQGGKNVNSKRVTKLLWATANELHCPPRGRRCGSWHGRGSKQPLTLPRSHYTLSYFVSVILTWWPPGLYKAMLIIWVMLQLLSFQHLRKVGGSWEDEPYSTCVLADATGGPPRGLGRSCSPGRTMGKWPPEEGELPDTPLGRTSMHGSQEQPGSCLFLLSHFQPAATASASFTVPKSEVLFCNTYFRH